MTACPFFNGRMAEMPRLAEIYSKRYCNGDCAQCALYMVFMVRGSERVPSDLFPSQKKRALAIISGA